MNKSYSIYEYVEADSGFAHFYTVLKVDRPGQTFVKTHKFEGIKELRSALFSMRLANKKLHAGYIIPGSAVMGHGVEGSVKGEKAAPAAVPLTGSSRHANLHQLPNNIARDSAS